ncbi:MAG: type II secretion system protein GspC [Pseudomonadota bacterium]
MANFAEALHLDGELLDRLVAGAPRLIAGVLIVLIGVRAALFVADLAGTPASTAAPAGPSLMQTRSIVDLPSILRSNLFGQAAAPAGADAPVTSMALILAGTIADIDEKRGYAILGKSATEMKGYSVGETVPGGARLHAVLVDRVLLDRGGTIESLLLPKRAAGGALTAAVAPPPLGAAERVQQLVRANPSIVGEILRPQVVIADGKQRGFRVYPGSNSEAFSHLGLRPGDLVIAINGSALDDPTRSTEIFNTLGSVAEARITVVRNGSQQDLLLNLAEVANEAEQLARSSAAAVPTGVAPPPGPLPPQAAPGPSPGTSMSAK